jgi:hypothetical protein
MKVIPIDKSPCALTGMVHFPMLVGKTTILNSFLKLIVSWLEYAKALYG